MTSHLQIDKEPQAVELQPILELSEPSSSRAEVLLGKLRRWSQSSVVRTAVRNLALIALWYVLGTSLTLWNKWLVDKKKAGFFGKGPFPAPFLLSSLQFFAQHLTARVLMATGISRRQGQGSDWKHYIKTVVPNGVATGLDIGFSNYSLVFITISFYVMCKSTTPLFLLIFAIAWGVEKASWSLAGVVVVIASGLLLLVAGETKFDLLGFLLVMTAAMLAGLRWTITQVLLHGHKAHGAGTPTEVIYQLTPVMGITVLLLSLFHDRLWNTLPGSPYFADLLSVFLTLLIVLAGGLIAFAMVWSEFMLIKCTSALTFMVAGTFKEIITVMAGVVLDGDRFTAINAVGLGVLILGVVLFNIQKYHKLRQGEMKPVHLEINGHDQHQGHKLTTPNEVPLEANGRGSSLAGSPAALSQLQERRGMVLLHEDEELMLSSGHMADVGEDVALLLPGAGSGFCVWEASQQQQHHQQQQEEQRVRSLAGSPRSPGGTQSLQRRDSV